MKINNTAKRLIITGTKTLPCLLITFSLAAPNTYAQIFLDDDEKHQFDFLIRTRYAQAEEGDNEAQTASMLFRGFVESDWNEYFNTLLEIDHVQAFLKDEYSDGVRFNGKATIPDVPGTEINQAFISYNSDLFDIHIGRQRLEFDDQRFIGSVSFWQNDQTFDALHGRYKFLTNSHISLSHIFNANRIYGDDADENLSPDDIIFDAFNGQRPASRLGDHKHNTNLTRLELNEWDYSQVIAYAYLIDIEELPSNSNNTVGGIYKFRYKQGNIKYRLELETSWQQRTELTDAPTVPRYVFDGGLGFNSFELSLRHEVLTARKGVGFVTPLDSGHEFQGWADVLPNSAVSNGIEDSSLHLNWRAAPWKIDARYHIFNRYEVDTQLGSELDFDITYKFEKNHTFFIRYANFQAASDYADRLGDHNRIFFNYIYSF